MTPETPTAPAARIRPRGRGGAPRIGGWAGWPWSGIAMQSSISGWMHGRSVNGGRRALWCGGTDATAVAITAALGSSEYEIFIDVPGRVHGGLPGRPRTHGSRRRSAAGRSAPPHLVPSVGTRFSYFLTFVRAGCPSRFQRWAGSRGGGPLWRHWGWHVPRRRSRDTARATVRMQLFDGSPQSWTSYCEPSRTSGLHVFGS
jgi:hypothetical protein